MPLSLSAPLPTAAHTPKGVDGLLFCFDPCPGLPCSHFVIKQYKAFTNSEIGACASVRVGAGTLACATLHEQGLFVTE